MFITLFIYSPFINVSTWPKRTFWSFITKPRFLIVYREQKICFQTFPISKNIWWSQTQLWLRRNTGRGYSISHDLPRLGSVMDQSSVASAEIMHLQNSPRAHLQPPSIFLNMDCSKTIQVSGNLHVRLIELTALSCSYIPVVSVLQSDCSGPWPVSNLDTRYTDLDNLRRCCSNFLKSAFPPPVILQLFCNVMV